MRLAELCGVAAPPHLPHSPHWRGLEEEGWGLTPPAARYLHRLLRHGIFFRLLRFFCQGRFFQGPGGDKDVSRGAEKPHPATARPHHPKESPPTAAAASHPSPISPGYSLFQVGFVVLGSGGPRRLAGGGFHPILLPRHRLVLVSLVLGWESEEGRGEKKKRGTEPWGALRRAAQPPPHKAALTLVRSPNAERFLGPPWGEDGDRLAWQLSSCNTVG